MKLQKRRRIMQSTSNRTSTALQRSNLPTVTTSEPDWIHSPARTNLSNPQYSTVNNSNNKKVNSSLFRKKIPSMYIHLKRQNKSFLKGLGQLTNFCALSSAIIIVFAHYTARSRIFVAPVANQNFRMIGPVVWIHAIEIRVQSIIFRIPGL